MLKECLPPKNFFSQKQWLFIFVILIIGVALRFFNLDLRPLHHDESIHALYSKYYYVSPHNLFYKYNPMLHGPMLYHFVPHFYDLFGMGKSSARAICALMGCLMLFIPLFFYRYLRPGGLIFLVSYMAFSPSLIYWSRFLREDYFFIFSQILFMASLFLFSGRWRAILASFFILLPLNIKENVFIFWAILLGLVFYEHLLFLLTRTHLINPPVARILRKCQLLGIKFTGDRRCAQRHIEDQLGVLGPKDGVLSAFAAGGIYEMGSKIKHKTLFQKLVENIKSFPKSYLLGVILSVLTFIYFYSAAGLYPDWFQNNIITTGLSYWWNQHSVERISGPFIYQTLVLGWYDFPFFLLIVVHVIHFYATHPNKFYKLFLAFILLFFVTLHMISHEHLLAIFENLKLKLRLDLAMFLFLIVHSLIYTTDRLLKNDLQKAYFGYLFWASLFSYSFVGEKVPWLALYPLTTGLIFALFLLDDFPQIKNSGWIKGVFAIVLIFQFRTALKVNFSQAGLANQLIGQVHTTYEFEKLAFDIKQKMLDPLGPNNVKVLVLKDATWPLSWFFFDVPGFYHESSKAQIQNEWPDYIFTNLSDYDSQKKYSQYHKKVIPLRHWWVPDYSELTLSNFLKYTFTQRPWNNTESFDINFYFK